MISVTLSKFEEKKRVHLLTWSPEFIDIDGQPIFVGQIIAQLVVELKCIIRISQVSLQFSLVPNPFVLFILSGHF
jgi:hypothetical protein